MKNETQDSYSSLFDRNWYLKQYPDVANSLEDPLDHYLLYGAREGRDPHPLFDTDWYLKQNPDVKESGTNPLQHFIEYGAREGRDPNPLFDTDWYLKQNPDVKESGTNPLQHFIEYGAREGRDPNPLLNYIEDDQFEGRDTNSLNISLTQLVVNKFDQYRIDKNGPLFSDDDVLIYLAYCARGELSRFQIRSIKEYASLGYRIILVINSGAYDRIIDPGENPSVIQITRENIGFDFGGWKHAIRIIGGLRSVRSVTFTNDSLIGPLSTKSSLPLRILIEKHSADAVFMTQNTEIKKHFQSFFFTFKKKALEKGALSIIGNAPYLNNKDRVIRELEVPLSTRIENLGVSTGILFPIPEAELSIKNPTIHYWRKLITNGFPFVKVTLITEKFASFESPDIKEILGNEWIELLKEHITNRMHTE